MFRYFAAIEFFLCAPSVAMACSPLPPGRAVELAQEAAAQVDRRKTSLIEAVVVRGAHWPETGALRVVRSHWGKIKSGTVLLVQPQSSSMCGPEHISPGERGIVQIASAELRRRPLPFFGFMQQYQLDAYKARGLLKR